MQTCERSWVEHLVQRDAPALRRVDALLRRGREREGRADERERPGDDDEADAHGDEQLDERVAGFAAGTHAHLFAELPLVVDSTRSTGVSGVPAALRFCTVVVADLSHWDVGSAGVCWLSAQTLQSP